MLVKKIYDLKERGTIWTTTKCVLKNNRYLRNYLKNECLLAYCQLSVSGQLNLLDNPPRKNYNQI